MKTNEFIAELRRASKNQLVFVDGNGHAVHPGYHLTELKAASLDTVDCGGQAILARLTQRSVETLSLTPGTPVYAVIKTVGFDRQTLGAAFPQANGADTTAIPI